MSRNFVLSPHETFEIENCTFIADGPGTVWVRDFDPIHTVTCLRCGFVQAGLSPGFYDLVRCCRCLSERYR